MSGTVNSTGDVAETHVSSAMKFDGRASVEGSVCFIGFPLFLVLLRESKGGEPNSNQKNVMEQERAKRSVTEAVVLQGFGRIEVT